MRWIRGVVRKFSLTYTKLFVHSSLIMSKAPKPTEAELAILGALWRRPGGGTVREVHEDLGSRTGYTSVLKLMQIMTDKGLLARDERGRTHVYHPAHPEAATQRRLAADLIT